MESQHKRILYLQYTNPGAYPPLEHSSRMLAEEGWEVLFLGIALQSKLQFPPYPGIRVEYIPAMKAGWRQKLHYGWFCLWVLGWVIRWRPRWIYACDPLSTPLTLVLSYIPWLKVVYHEHDSPSPNPSSRFFRAILRFRRALVHRVDAIILPNSKRGELLRSTTQTTRPVYGIWNCPTKEEVVPVPVRKATPLRLLYHGTIVPQRVPLSVIEAVAKIKDDIEIHIAGYEPQGAIGYGQTLQEHAQQLGIANRVLVHGTIATRGELLVQARECHIGLSFMPLITDDVNMEMMVGASSKSFDYMACGLSLLVSPLPDWEEVFVANGFAIACDPTNPTDLANAIQWYLDHPEAQQQMGIAGQKQILEHWNYEETFRPILNLITAA